LKKITKVWKYRKSIKYILFYHLYVKRKCRVKMHSIQDTLDTIKEGISICRFGEGEFKWILNLKQDSFQADSEEMTSELKAVLKSDEGNILVCIPEIFNLQGNGANDLIHSSKRYWEIELGENGLKFWSLLEKDKCYYNLNITRFYIDYKNKEKAEEYFNKWKNIWKAYEIVIAEGEFTRFGVGNDLLSEAKRIERIICPATNAYAGKKEIMEYIENNVEKSKLILLALGPTATILAYELHMKGFWAIDIGHLDVEYEWFLKRADKKMAIEGKFVNEAGGMFGSELTEDNLKTYQNQIIYNMTRK